MKAGKTWSAVVYAGLLCALLSGCLYEAAETQAETPTDSGGEGGGETPAPEPAELPELASCNGPCSCDEMVRPANDTGVTFSGVFPSGNLASCADTTNPQDCDFGRDRKAALGELSKTGSGAAGFDFVKVSANGDLLDKDATSWQCVLDVTTGLMWEVKAPDDAQGLRASNQTYSWSDNGQPDYTSVNLGECQQESCDTQHVIGRTNSAGLCGFNDWRLPTKTELQDLVYYANKQPSIDTDLFPNIKSDIYWTSTLDTDDVGSVWSVNFNFGTVAGGSSRDPHHVLLVRNASVPEQPAAEITEPELDISLRNRLAPLQRCSDVGVVSSPNSRFKRDDAGNVFDSWTGLIWRRCVEGLSGDLCDEGEVALLDWQQAIVLAVDASEAEGLTGENRWRLPSIKELQQTVETHCEEPPLNPFAFPNMPLDQVWSSTPHTGLDGHSYQYQYQNGILFYAARQQRRQLHLVRQCQQGVGL